MGQSEHMAARRALYRAEESLGLTWEGPFRSPASRGTDRRIRFHVYAPKAAYSALGAHMLCALLKKTDGLQNTNIGTEELSNDDTAKIIDTPTIRQLDEVADLIQAVLILSPTEAIIDTRDTKLAWELRLSELSASNPAQAIRAVKWRHGRGGARGRGHGRCSTLPPECAADLTQDAPSSTYKDR